MSEPVYQPYPTPPPRKSSLTYDVIDMSRFAPPPPPPPAPDMARINHPNPQLPMLVFNPNSFATNNSRIIPPPSLTPSSSPASSPRSRARSVSSDSADSIDSIVGHMRGRRPSVDPCMYPVPALDRSYLTPEPKTLLTDGSMAHGPKWVMTDMLQAPPSTLTMHMAPPPPSHLIMSPKSPRSPMYLSSSPSPSPSPSPKSPMLFPISPKSSSPISISPRSVDQPLPTMISRSTSLPRPTLLKPKSSDQLNAEKNEFLSPEMRMQLMKARSKSVRHQPTVPAPTLAPTLAPATMFVPMQQQLEHILGSTPNPAPTPASSPALTPSTITSSNSTSVKATIEVSMPKFKGRTSRSRSRSRSRPQTPSMLHKEQSFEALLYSSDTLQLSLTPSSMR
ncbi:hypothetical protein HDU97_009315 [Phlyctochytrium planicorne]|nr:hypothetical protein HDU97_009315 [Phlyctochytrium planicorne]